MMNLAPSAIRADAPVPQDEEAADSEKEPVIPEAIGRLLGVYAPHRIPAGAPVRRIKYTEQADADTDEGEDLAESYAASIVARRQRLLNALTTHRWIETAYLSGAAAVQLDTARRDLHELVRLGLAERRTASSEINQGSTGWWRAIAAGQRVPPAPPRAAPEPIKHPERDPKRRVRISAAEMADRRERVLLALSCHEYRETADVARRAGVTLAIVYTDLRRLEFSQRAQAMPGKSAGGKSHTIWWRAR